MKPFKNSEILKLGPRLNAYKRAYRVAALKWRDAIGKHRLAIVAIYETEDLFIIDEADMDRNCGLKARRFVN